MMNSYNDTYLIGYGLITPFGTSVQALAEYLNNESQKEQFCSMGALKKVSSDKNLYVQSIDEFVIDDFLDDSAVRNFDKHSEYASAAANIAIRDSGIDLHKYLDNHKSVCMGTFASTSTSLSNFDESVYMLGPRRCDIGTFPSTIMSAAASRVSILETIKGSNTTICSGKNSGFDAVGYSSLEIKSGGKKIVLCGGVDALSEKILGAFAEQGLIFLENSEIKRKSYGERFIPSEGACLLVLSASPGKCSCKIKSFANGFSTSRKENIEARASDLAACIHKVVIDSGVPLNALDLVLLSSYFSSSDLRTEMRALELVFVKTNECPAALSLKKYLGESFSVFGAIMYVIGDLILKDIVSLNTLNDACINDREIMMSRGCANILLISVDSFGHYSASIMQK